MMQEWATVASHVDSAPARERNHAARPRTPRRFCGVFERNHGARPRFTPRGLRRVFERNQRNAGSPQFCANTEFLAPRSLIRTRIPRSPVVRFEHAFLAAQWFDSNTHSSQPSGSIRTPTPRTSVVRLEHPIHSPRKADNAAGDWEPAAVAVRVRPTACERPTRTPHARESVNVAFRRGVRESCHWGAPLERAGWRPLASSGHWKTVGSNAGFDSDSDRHCSCKVRIW